MAVSNSNGGLGSPTGDLVITTACGTIGVVVGSGSPGGWSWRDEDWGKSATAVSKIGTSSFVTCVTSTSGFVSGGWGSTVSGLGPPGEGSGKHSRFDFSQRGQTQLLDLESGRGGLEQ